MVSCYRAAFATGIPLEEMTGTCLVTWLLVFDSITQVYHLNKIEIYDYINWLSRYYSL